MESKSEKVGPIHNNRKRRDMMRGRLRLLAFTISLGFAIILLPSGDSFAASCEKSVARMVSIQGVVQVKRAGESQWQAVKLNESFCPGDVIQAQKNSRADIALANQPVLRLDQNSVVTLGGLKDERTSVLTIVKGAAHFFSRVTRGLDVQTAFVNAGVEGTEFFIRVEGDKTVLSVFEGKVLASNAEGSLAITGGQSAVAEAGKAPVAMVVVRPRDAVQWALYYPPVISYRPDQFRGGAPADWQEMVRKSLELYWKGDLSGTFSSIEGAPSDIRDARYFIYRASLLLTVGRVDESDADIRKALSLDPKNSNAFALQSVIAAVRNDKEKALDLARKAVETDPNSGTARVALSYAQQSDFDLDGALKSLQDAVKLEPGNALAWARLSELWLSFGRLDNALTAADKAVTLNPNLSRTQTVLGFAYLTQVRTRESQTAFRRAIELDNADPLPRLGLGLSQIREGNLNEGAREIEISASLDPDNALIRSYLGKAFYEEKRDKQSSEEFSMARNLDKQDPTPFFYDAIHKQTTNRPVEALQDLQKAIELNDNRAVYRSKLLLDADLAARSASLARVYTDLGFQQLALVEGWKSVNTDPSDFSGHRFLSDTYSALPRHEIARVSELLQSQLLQPLNMTPIQPRLAESNLFLNSAGGPASLSFNEFNSLFNRDGLTVQASGLAGENKTWSGEGILAGIYKKASYSVGFSRFETEGWRQNADQNDSIANAFVQLQLSPSTSIQAEYRYRDTDYGDLAQRFYGDDFSPNLRNKDERNSMRLGFHQNFSPGSDLIGNFMYQHGSVRITDAIPDYSILYQGDNFHDKAYSSELQYLYRAKSVSLIGGAGYFRVKSDDKSLAVIDLSPPDPPFEFPDEFIRKIDHTNLYLYSSVNFLKNATFTIGASGDFYHGGLTDENKFNPKFGITWSPFAGTTLRGAAFRSFKRTLITNQTLEPTQVAGFNQFFDDTDQTDSWNYGIAADQKFSKTLFAGAEFFLRDLKFPFLNQIIMPDETVVDEIDKNKWHERSGRAYIYWTPHKWVGLSAEYLYERFTRDQPFTLGLSNVETHRVPIGLNFYHPSGLSVMLKGTYVNQQGSFERQNPFPTQVFEHGEDQFFLFDAAINFRMPKRLGSVTIGAKNLFDKSFKYYDTDRVSPAIQPGRTMFGKLTLSF